MDRGAPLPRGDRSDAQLMTLANGSRGFVLLRGRGGDLPRPRTGGFPASRFLGSLTPWGLGTGHASALWEDCGGRTPVAGETPQ